jgi:endonuclease I
MKTSVVYNTWVSYMVNRMPCPITSYSMSKEHVAPKSLFPSVLVNDKHNIIPMPARLNNHRGRRPYTKLWEDGYAVYSCENCATPGFCRGAGLSSVSGIFPPDLYKGPIARSVLYNNMKFPALSQKLNDKVLDLRVAQEWNLKYPMSDPEKMWLWTLDGEI